MSEVLINKENSTIVLTLNRERVLNALNLNMVRIISENISSWNDDDSISGVLLIGAGEKAFCAGGDIVSVYHSKNDEGNNLSYDFFKEEYLLNYEISKFKKPWISILNGIAMGGGLGLSVHGSHRIVSEKTLTAMPETAIGLFPDVGGGYFLSRVDHFVGTYLALTGKTLDGDNTIFAKIGTHFIENNLVNECIKKVLNLKKYTKYDIDFILKKYDKKTKTYPSLEKELLNISKHFNKKSIKEIINSLKEENSTWCKEQLNILEKKSPTSMGVATRQLDISRSLNLKDCLSMEFRICQAMMDRHDFYEGVRANLVDKDRDPKWKPITVDLLEEKLIDDHFKNLEDKELF